MKAKANIYTDCRQSQERSKPFRCFVLSLRYRRATKQGKTTDPKSPHHYHPMSERKQPKTVCCIIFIGDTKGATEDGITPIQFNRSRDALRRLR